MAISKAFIVPHPPLIIPKVGLGQEAGIHKTFTSYHEAAKEIEKQKPETIIIITPHGVTYSDYFHIASGDVIEGSMKEFGSSDVICVPCDVELSDKISSICEKADFPAGTLGNASNNMDHGTYVPLYFINQYYRDYKIVCISISGLPLREHYRLGMFINEAVNELGRNAIIIASGDLSHKLKEYGPYGYAKEGPALDRIMTEAMKTGNFLDFLEIDEELRKRGAECGLGSFTIMSGVLHKKSLDINFLSYEGPFGVGYAVCIYQVNEDDDNRDFLKEYDEIKNQRLQKIKEKEDEYVKLARYTLEHYILTRRLPSLPENLSPELLDRKAGVFVSIKKNGKLRGCIGTLEPSHDNVALEIMYNAVSAGTRDPRFAEVRKEELPDLLYSIDVLFLPEAVKNIEELDPIKYGIIVTSGYKRGVLLPELAEIETVEDQIKIACEKAGITEDEEYITFSCTELEYENIWKHYFDLETDYSYIKGRIDPEDSYMIRASECGGGIRILRQELFETIISFIISQQNNIPRIKKCIRALAERYGEVKYNYKNQQYYTFPKPDILANLKEDELKSLGLGYRSRYIVETANSVINGSVDLRKLKIMSYNDSKKELMQLSGVGNKVSDCICLFALHHIDAFPIDTHINDVLVRYYKNGFPLERYNGFAGVLQQYAFYYEVYGAKYMRLSKGVSGEL